MPGLGRFYHAMAQLDDITYLIGGQEPINAISSKSKPRKEVFYKNNLENDWERLQGGDFNTVLVTFQANPKPINGEWRIGETMVPLGKASEDNVFRSSELSPIENS